MINSYLAEINLDWLTNIVNNDIVQAVTNVLTPILIIACLVGVIYAIWVGITFAKADSADQRKEAKSKLITVIVGIVVAVVLIILFFWVKNSLQKKKIDLDPFSCCHSEAKWNADKSGILEEDCCTCTTGDDCTDYCHCWKCCTVENVNGKKYIHGTKDTSFWKDEDGDVVSDPTRASTVSLNVGAVYQFMFVDNKWALYA